MGMVTHGALSSAIVARKSLMWDVPDHWTLEDAATVPVVYGTVSQKVKH
jgi:fatty acid synthase